ncbi:uncharacterized protein LOC130713041 [Lotus japonicus]|uniref:uncharacterized protein LOC130713041 n=1 Tax=Lotus japonicus TaxID=34305 RepID=UPI0025898AEE|nr:uncharacterized protein LOC130713041 [Lotus japonicus]
MEGSSFGQWLERKFQILAQRGDEADSAICYLGYTLWELWKMRNAYVFNDYKPNPAFCIQRINLAFQEGKPGVITSPETSEIHPLTKRSYQWRRPPRGFQKCNTDAGLNNHKNKAMGSMIFRNDKGDITFGSTSRFFTSKPLIAEALALRAASLAAANMKMEKILFESDNLQLIEACLRRKTMGAIQNIVEDILTWKKDFPTWGFTWTGRSENHSAHVLSNLALHDSLNPQRRWNPPQELWSALVRDKQLSQEYIIKDSGRHEGDRTGIG